ncbi:MAG: hypothetical protein OEY86_00940 [Nitrospira sp.]|nr:hypothetical protein [Nitrospira sp.]
MTDERVQSLAKKRQGMDLSALFHDPTDPRRKALVEAFGDQLREYIELILAQDTGDHEVLWARAKAMGVIETLTAMGQTMDQVNEVAAKAAQQKARVSLGI